MSGDNFTPVDPAMLGGASVGAKPSSLSAYTGSGASPNVMRADLSEYDPYRRLKLSVLKSMGSTFDKAIEHSKENAYVQGMADYMTGIAEEEMDTHPLTKAWATAGFRDTSGRMAMVDYKAKLINDIDTKFASESPEVFKQHLHNSRPMVLRHINETSSISKKDLLETLVQHEASLIMKHAEAHAAFAQQVEQDTTSAEMNLAIAELNHSANTGAAPMAIQGAVQVVQNLLNNPRYSGGEGVSSALSFVKAIADNGHSDLALEMLDGIAYDVNGHPMSLLQMGDFEEVEKVRKGILDSKRSFRDQRMLGQRLDWNAKIDAVLHDPTEDSEPLKNDILSAVMYGDILWSEANRLLGRLEAGNDPGKAKVSPADALSMWVRGDFEGMQRTGVTSSTAQRYALEHVEGMSATERLGFFAAVATNGNPEGHKMVGVVASGALNRFYNTGDVEGEDLEIINTFVDVFNQRAFTENPAASFESILAGVPSDTALFLRGAFERFVQFDETQRTGDAWMEAMQQQRSFMVGTPEFEKTTAAKHDEVVKAIRADATDGERKFLNVFGLFSKGRRLEKVMPNNAMVFTGDGHKNMVALASGEFMANAIERGKSMASTSNSRAQHIAEQAQLDVVQSSFMLKSDTVMGIRSGPYKYLGVHVGNPGGELADVMPKGSSLQGADVAKEVIHSVVDQAIRGIPQAENRDLRVVSNYRGGVLNVKVLDNSTGATLAQPTLGGAEIRELGQRVHDNLLSERVARSEGTYAYLVAPHMQPTGTNALITDPSKAGPSAMKLPITAAIDPTYGAGVDWNPHEIVAIRKSIIEFENMRWHWYPDDSRAEEKRKAGKADTIKHSIGFGFSDSSEITKEVIPRSQRQITVDQLEQLFVKSTSNAMREAQMHMRELPPGTKETPYKAMLTHMLYQAGEPNFRRGSSYQRMQDALEAGDITSAKRFMQQTPAYVSGGKGRQQMYDKLIDSIY